MAEAVLAAEELRHAELGVAAPRQGIAMVPVVTQYVVIVPSGIERPDRDRLLADVEVEEPTHLGLGIRLGGMFLEMPDQHHLAVHVPTLGGRQP
jgi:hypothetical protein